MTPWITQELVYLSAVLSAFGLTTAVISNSLEAVDRNTPNVPSPPVQPGRCFLVGGLSKRMIENTVATTFNYALRGYKPSRALKVYVVNRSYASEGTCSNRGPMSIHG